MRHITKNMNMAYIIKEYPETIKILKRYGMGCLDCPTAKVESLEKASMLHGMDVIALLEELNKTVRWD